MSVARTGPLVRVPTAPEGVQIAAYPAYVAAQQAVDYLAEQRFSVDQLTIVGTDLRSVERVTGRLTYGRVAVAGAMSGAWFGLFVGLLLSLFGGAGVIDGIVFIAVAIGAGFGLLFSVLSYAITGRRRDFTSTTQTVAGTYALLCAPATEAQARALLAASPVGLGATSAVLQPWGGSVGGGGTIISGSDNSEAVSSSQVVSAQVLTEQALPGGQPPTVQLGPVAATSQGPAAPSQGAPTRPVDPRWTLPNGAPRYGALAEDHAVPAQSGAIAPTSGPGNQNAAPQ